MSSRSDAMAAMSSSSAGKPAMGSSSAAKEPMASQEETSQMAALKTETVLVQVLVQENVLLRQQQQDAASQPAAVLQVLSEVVRELRQENELLRQQQSATVREIFVLGEVVQELRRESELMKQQQSVVSQQAENLRALGVVVQEMVTHFSSTSGRVDDRYRQACDHQWFSDSDEGADTSAEGGKEKVKRKGGLPSAAKTHRAVERWLQWSRNCKPSSGDGVDVGAAAQDGKSSGDGANVGALAKEGRSSNSSRSSGNDRGNSVGSSRPFQGYCNNCSKWGHKAADCWKKKARYEGETLEHLAQHGPGAYRSAGGAKPEEESLGALDLSSAEVDSSEWLKLNYDTGAAVTAFPKGMVESSPNGGNGRWQRTVVAGSANHLPRISETST